MSTSTVAKEARAAIPLERVGARRREWAAAALILLLVAAVVADRLGVRVGGINVRLEFIVGAASALAAVALRPRAALRGWGLVDLALAGWLAANLLSSLLFSPDTAYSLKYVAVLAGLGAVYVAARLLVKDWSTLPWAAVALTLAGGAAGLVGVGCTLMFNVAGPNFGVLLERFYRDGIFLVTPKVQSVLWEPNIFGSFSMAVCALSSALTLRAYREERDRLHGLPVKLPRIIFPLVTAICMAGVMLSMTRTVWALGPALVALMAAVAWRVGLETAGRIARLVLLPALVGGALGLGLGLSLPAPQWAMGPPWDLTSAQVEEMVRQRIVGGKGGEVERTPVPSGANATPAPEGASTATPVPAGEGMAAGERVGELLEGGAGEAPSLAVRARIFRDAFEGWLKRPLLGWGAGAFPLVYPPPPEGGYWIANIELHALFDTGVVGLALLMLAGVAAGLRALRAVRMPASGWGTHGYVTFGLLWAAGGLLAAYQVTDGSWLGFTWVLLAMLVAAGRPEGS